MLLTKIVGYLNDTLRIEDFPLDSALNGLQVEGTGRVMKAALAVDVCERSIRSAARSGADILIVHHGLFWGGARPVTGPTAKRLRLLLKNGISLYAAHLPLDCHEEVGNNAQLAAMLDIEETTPFGKYHGIKLGLYGNLPRRVTPGNLAARLKKLLGTPAAILTFGPPSIRRLAIASGGAALLAQEASENGCDALLTGETAHSAYHTAKDAGISLICAGHYATEAPGVRALGELLRRELGLPSKFIDIPTGL